MPKAQKCNKQLKRWHFSLREEHGGKPADVIKSLSAHFKKYCFQLESGETGYKHYQGRVSSSRPYRKSELINLGLFNKNIHWSAESNNGEEAGSFYVIKEDGRLEGPWSDKDRASYIPKHLRSFTPTPVQNWILTRLNTQHHRKVLFIIDADGNNGKTWLGMYLASTGGIRVPSTLVSADQIMQMIMASVISNPSKKWNIILDIPRSVHKESGWTKWISAIEEIKNGFAYDQRYAYKAVMFEPPNIVVFANEHPPPSCLTGDRFDIFEIARIKELAKPTSLGAAL